MMYPIVFLCLFAVCIYGEEHQREVFDRPEGSKCSWYGLEGKCTNVHNCPSAQDAIREKSYPPICSFQGRTPIVCCTIGRPITKTTQTGVRAELNVDPGSKAKEHCLKYETTLQYPCNRRIPFNPHVVRNLSVKDDYDKMRPPSLTAAGNSHQLSKRQANSQNARGSIEPGSGASFAVGGSPAFRQQYPHMNASGSIEPGFGIPSVGGGAPAYRQQYPHMALLGYGDDVQSAQWLCGGSVISDKYILTAAHCISSPAVGPVQFIALGILKRSDPPEYWQIYNVKRIIAHPEFKPPSKYNDIALLETEKTINFDLNVLPACLHLEPESNQKAQATGWGALGYRKDLADILQTVDLQRYDKEKCSQLYPKHRLLHKGYNHTTQMCYGDSEKPKDTCEGDSGGPLQTVNEFPSCAYTVLGVTSYGRQCGIPAGSGMYTRVYHYVPWIEKIVWP